MYCLIKVLFVDSFLYVVMYLFIHWLLDWSRDCLIDWFIDVFLYVISDLFVVCLFSFTMYVFVYSVGAFFCHCQSLHVGCKPAPFRGFNLHVLSNLESTTRELYFAASTVWAIFALYTIRVYIYTYIWYIHCLYYDYAYTVDMYRYTVYHLNDHLHHSSNWMIIPRQESEAEEAPQVVSVAWRRSMSLG